MKYDRDVNRYSRQSQYRSYNYYDHIDPNDEDRLDDLRMQQREMKWARQFLKDNEGWGYND